MDIIEDDMKYFEEIATSVESGLSGKELEIINVTKKARIVSVNERKLKAEVMVLIKSISTDP